MKKILIINTVTTGLNGVTNVIFNYLRAKNDDTCQVDILSRNLPDEGYLKELQCRGVLLYILDRRKNVVEYMLKLCILLRKNKYDIIHIHGNSHTVCVELLVAWISGCSQRIIHAHSTHCKNVILHKFLTPLFNILCTKRLACGHDAGRFMFGNKEFFVLNNGVDTDVFKYDQSSRNKTRTALGIRDDSVVIGNVAMFTPAKNQSYILPIFKELYMNNHNYRLLLLGDGEQKYSVQQEVEAMGLKEVVIFTGNVSNVQNFLSAMDIIIMPSLFEGLPLSLIEQQANGLYCVCSSNISTEVDKTGNLSFLSLSAHIEQWVKIISSFDLRNREERSRKAIESIINANYSIQGEAAKLYEIYDNC